MAHEATALAPTFAVGTFSMMPSIQYLHEGLYRLLPTGFSFTRATGQKITPGPMDTDGLTIPRLLWAFKGLDAMTFFPAGVIHDWLFVNHWNGDQTYTHADAALILGECCQTLVAMGLVNDVPQRRVNLIYFAVLIGGVKIWDGPAPM